MMLFPPEYGSAFLANSIDRAANDIHDKGNSIIPIEADKCL
jgi:hypothetical protein